MSTPSLAVTVNGVSRYHNPHRHGDAPVYVSVTHTVKGLPQDWQIPWSALVTATKAVTRSEAWGSMEDQEAIAWIKSAPYQSRDAGRDRGNLTHEAMAAILQGRDPPIS